MKLSFYSDFSYSSFVLYGYKKWFGDVLDLQAIFYFYDILSRLCYIFLVVLMLVMGVNVR